MILTPILPFLLAPGVLSEIPAASIASQPEEPITATVAQEEETQWVGNAFLGLTYLSGNTESTTASAGVSFTYDEDIYQWLLSANYAGVRTNTGGTSTTTSRLYATGGQYNHFMDEEKNLFFYGKASARKDVPVGLELRWDAGAGAGYTWYLADDDKTFFSLEGGPSFVHEENVGAEETDAANARVAFRYGNPLWDEWDFNALGEYFQSLDESEDKSFTGQMSVDYKLKENWSLRGLVAVAWDNTPAAGFESTDRRVEIGLSFSF